MNDDIKLLLELAVKTLKGQPGFEHPMLFEEDDGSGWYVKLAKHVYWRPHLDDGDSRRLEVALGLCVSQWPRNEPPDVMVGYLLCGGNGSNIIEDYGNDACAATRMAVLRAAAEIGRNME